MTPDAYEIMIQDKISVFFRQCNGWGKNRTGFSGTFRTTEK